MSKFTPGPWIKTSLGRIVMTNDTKESICRLATRTDADEQDANARLIAAAPDLLNALQAVANALEWHEDRMPKGQDSGALDLARAAITKAKGA